MKARTQQRHRTDCGEVAKSQLVRTVDVAILGPLTILAGLHQGPLPRRARFTLVVGGLATIAYNYRNWRATEAEQGRR